MTNTLYYGDNLHVLREHVASGRVDEWRKPFSYRP